MDFSNLDELMRSLPSRGFPISQIAIAKAGKVVYRQTVKAPEAAGEMEGKDTYWIFSATKVITCIAALRLVERDIIRLSDPVSRYIPEFADVMVRRADGTLTPPVTEMTVEHLFTMSAGLTYNMNTSALREARTETATTLDVVRAMAKDPLSFDPGSHYAYSLCHDVLAAVVEVVSGMHFGDYLRKEIFSPLGIESMGFHPDEARKERFLPMYYFVSGTNTTTPKKVYNGYRLTPLYESGGAGLFATVEDYIKIIGTIAAGGTAENGYVLLRPETIGMMQENRLCPDAKNDFTGVRFFGYGHGLCCRVHMDPHISFSKSSVGEFGWDSASGDYVMIDPKEQIAVFFATHIMDCKYVYHMIHPRIRDAVYEALQ